MSMNEQVRTALEQKMIQTPAYIFDFDRFEERCRQVRDVIGEIPLTFSMKANPFLLVAVKEKLLGNLITHVEVCSPGELQICKKLGIPGENIIYSGVMKEEWDVEDAVSYGADILTAESRLHVEFENQAVCSQKTQAVKVLLRLTSGNQFGMSEEEIEDIIAHREEYPGLEFIGIHYYSGTQKKMRQIKKDFVRIRGLLAKLKENYGFEPQLVEYGPGASVEYFADGGNRASYGNDNRTVIGSDLAEWTGFRGSFEEIRAFAEDYPTGIEMGRFLASDCGSYLTMIKDLKINHGVNYLICDGGIHHLKYYGQTMGIQVPPLELLSRKEKAGTEEKIPYTLCGSLCTVADVMIRELELPEVNRGDVLMFHKCGAYSVSEASALFLSRRMPEIWCYSEDHGLRLLRGQKEAYEINLADLSIESEVMESKGDCR